MISVKRVANQHDQKQWEVRWWGETFSIHHSEDDARERAALLKRFVKFQEHGRRPI